MTLRTFAKLSALSLASTFFGLVWVETAVRVTRLDERLIKQSLFFQGNDIQVHRVSADPFLHYELKPGASYRGTFPGKPPYDVNIDQHGARFPTHEAAKPAATFRILAFGGSTLYGGAVDDSDTVAAAIERRLNRENLASHPPLPAVEVWNFGTSAYMLGQATHLARRKLPLLSPDLILIQHHNRGRRAFLIPADRRYETYPFAALVADPYFYDEQFSAFSFVPLEAHRRLMVTSATYRAVVATLRPSTPMGQIEFADTLSANEARSLNREAAERHVPVVYFAIPAGRGSSGLQTIFLPELTATQYIDLYRPDRDAAFYEVHPPGATLDEFAVLLIEELKARHLIPAAAHD